MEYCLRLPQSKLEPLFIGLATPLHMGVQIGVTRWHKHLHIDSAMWFKGLDHTYVAPFACITLGELAS